MVITYSRLRQLKGNGFPIHIMTIYGRGGRAPLIPKLGSR